MNKPFRSADTEPPGCAKAFGGARLTHPCLQEVHSGGKREEIRGPLRTRGQGVRSVSHCGHVVGGLRGAVETGVRSSPRSIRVPLMGWRAKEKMVLVEGREGAKTPCAQI